MQANSNLGLQQMVTGRALHGLRQPSPRLKHGVGFAEVEDGYGPS